MEPAVAPGWCPGVRNVLCRAFCSEEVDRDPRLKIICGVLLLYFHMTFHEWWSGATPLSTHGDEVFNYAPAAVIENFRWWVFLDLFQARAWLYGLGMLSLLGLFSLFWSRSSLLAMGILAFVFVNKVFFYLCDFRLFANFHHFHLFCTLVFLVAADKLRFFRGALGMGYIMAGIVKLTPSWLAGEYFNSLPGKLPLLPKAEWIVTAACITVIVIEFLGPLCWFARQRWLRRLSVAAFVLFHLYSGLIVGYFYTTLMVPLVVAAFWGFEQPLHHGYRFARRHLAPLGIFSLALAGSTCHYLVPGDVRWTAEGRYFGFFMFDAHHTVRFEAKIRKGSRMWVVTAYRNWKMAPDHEPPDFKATCVLHENGTPVGQFFVNEPIVDGGEVIFNPEFFRAARMRISGDPYLYYYYARELVRRYQPDQLSIFVEQRLDGQTEGAPLIDLPDFAARAPTYRVLGRNDWILLRGEDGLREEAGETGSRAP